MTNSTNQYEKKEKKKKTKTPVTGKRYKQEIYEGINQRAGKCVRWSKFS